MADFHAASINNGKSNDISAVIFDLDGTLLSTEQLTKDILKEFLARYGKVPDKEKENKRLGMTQKESAIAIVNDYHLPLTPDQFTQEILPFYHGKWLLAKPLPGANRLLKHLQKHKVPFALASNSLRRNVDAKISHQQGWKEYFSVILGSDQVKAGKPSPDIFLEAANRMGVHAANCLVIEDSLIGVKAARAAGRKVLAVPSIQTETNHYLIADYILHSLLEFQPELWGLPPFEDWVENALPIEPIDLKCSYRNGVLNISDDGLSNIPDQLFGLHIGWAQIDAKAIMKVVMSIGWHYAGSSSKREIQACLIDQCGQNYDQDIQVHVVGYLRRPDKKGNELNRLEIGAQDKIVAGAALDLPEFSYNACNSFLNCHGQ